MQVSALLSYRLGTLLQQKVMKKPISSTPIYSVLVLILAELVGPSESSKMPLRPKRVLEVRRPFLSTKQSLTISGSVRRQTFQTLRYREFTGYE